MATYFIKPILWNEAGYSKPAGGKFQSGYPADFGFGHEEWNNSPRSRVRIGRKWIRYFHAEGLGNVPVDNMAGDIWLFLIASFEGKQHLVWIARGCSYVAPAEALRIAQANGFDGRWKEAWQLPSVREKFLQDQKSFREKWRKELPHHANWSCPDALFSWFVKPIPLTPARISGKSKLVQEYGSYQKIPPAIARRFIALAQIDNPGGQLESAAEAIETPGSDIRTDIEAIVASKGKKRTEIKRLIDARLGQGGFRKQLLMEWQGKCAVTGCKLAAVLRASHIKPWSQSSDTERLDKYNGLILRADLDALFDVGLITFGSDGRMLVSNQIGIKERRLLGIRGRLRRKLVSAQQRYLAVHRAQHKREFTS